MQISSRFTIAVHVLICIGTFRNDYKITSDFLASSVNVNPVVIRRIIQQLKKAGIITVTRRHRKDSSLRQMIRRSASHVSR